jgi:hypothetical protein
VEKRGVYILKRDPGINDTDITNSHNLKDAVWQIQYH